MGKHLAPTQKHELNFIKFIKEIPYVLSGLRRPVRAAEAPPEKKKPAPPARSIPVMGRHPWVFYGFAAALLIVIRFLPLEGWMVPAAYAIPALLALPEHAARAYDGIRAGDYLNRALIVCLAAVLLFAVRLYAEPVVLLILVFACAWLESRLQERCETDSEKIKEILPESAVLLTNEGPQRVDPASVSPGDILLVPAGERIPLDGVIVDGITTIDTAAVSGQRSPWAVNAGYRVYSGCRNLTSDIKIRVSRPYAQSTVRKIVHIAEAVSDFPSEQELAADTIHRWYVPALLVFALFTGLVLPIFRGAWIFYLRRASVFLIAACTCMDGCALSLLYRKAIQTLERIGVFAKGKDCLEAVARADTVIFDKTGTITEGRYTVTDVVPVKMSEKQLLTIAAAGESFSRHPIAAAIREAAGKLDERVAKAARLQEIPGRGVSAVVVGRRLLVGNAALLEEHDIRYSIPSHPGTAVHVAVDNRYCGYIMVTDRVRRRAFDALETLRVNGIKKLVLLTGDVLSVARPIASRLNFDMLRAELKPEDKVKAVNYLMKNKGVRLTIAFVGDGENSGKTMTHADVGIAMGSLGSDAALASADVMIMDRDIFKLTSILTISRLTYRAGLENLSAGIGLNALFALFGACGFVSPLAAEILCTLLCALLLANTLRIK